MDKYSQSYGRDYYKNYDTADYGDASLWETQFSRVAERIVSVYRPSTVLDIGCAYGYLVTALRDRGVEAYGLDVSDYAISQVRSDIRQYCVCGSAVDGIPDSLPEHFDLIVCIEMIEHIYEEDTEAVIRAMCARTDRIVLSSTDSDYDDPLHVNVQKQEYWAKRFARHGFLRDVNAAGLEISSNTMVFERSGSDIPHIVEAYEHRLRLCCAETTALRTRAEEVSAELTERRQTLDTLQRESEAYRRGAEEQLRSLEAKCAETEARCRGELDDRDAQNAALQADCEAKAEEIGTLSREKEEWIELACERFNLLREYQQKSADCDVLRSELAELRETLAGVNSSVSWRITAPCRKVMHGVKSVLKKFPIMRKAWPYLQIWKRHGFRAMIRHRREVKGGRSGVVCVQPGSVPAAISAGSTSSSDIVRATNHPTDPISVVYTDDETKRLNLVTDSLNPDSLLGGTATALICATKLAAVYGYELRIITRNADVNAVGYRNAIEISGIEPPEKVSFFSDWQRHTSPDSSYKLELGRNEVFLATSWWSATAIRATAPQSRLLYIIQEVENFFYNYGSEHLLCTNIMNAKGIDFIVNSHYLNDYFAKEYPNITEHGCFFEPAFSQKLYKCGSFHEKEKYKLFFYARPNNPRNLFAFGVNLLNRAIAEGILDMSEWEICCAGQSAPKLTFCDGSHSINLGQMSWEEYARFLSDVDLGLCLMYTPHPSYPPYDVACSGGVVLSNKMLNKQHFDECSNVILADLDDDSVLDGFRAAVALARNAEQRKKNYLESRFCRDWNTAMEPVVEHMKGIL